MLARRGEKTVIRDNPDNPQKAKVEVVGSVGDADEIQETINTQDWNEYRIRAEGNHLQQWINGHQTVDVLDEQKEKAKSEGILALQLHAGPAMTVQFKDIKLTELGK